MITTLWILGVLFTGWDWNWISFGLVLFIDALLSGSAYEKY